MQKIKQLIMKHYKTIGKGLFKYFIVPIVTSVITTLILALFGIGTG